MAQAQPQPELKPGLYERLLQDSHAGGAGQNSVFREPQVTPNLSNNEKALDSISRIIGIGGGTVGAVCWDSDNNRFLVATNGHDSTSTTECFNAFSNISNPETRDAGIAALKSSIYNAFNYDIDEREIGFCTNVSRD